MNKRHNDCLNFTPVDVAKGICRRTNKIVFIDSDVCGNFEALPKCKNCAFFKNKNKDNIGVCTAYKKDAWTYGDLTATTCKGYKKEW